MPVDDPTGARHSQFSFRLQAGGRHLMAMSRVSGLGDPARGPRGEGALTLERGVLDDQCFLSWLECGAGVSTLRAPVETKDLTLELRDVDGEITIAWTIRQACPVEFIGLPGSLDGGCTVIVERLVLRHGGAERAPA